MAEFAGYITKIIFETSVYVNKAVFVILNGNIARQQIDNMVEIGAGKNGWAAGISFWRLSLICHDPIQNNEMF